MKFLIVIASICFYGCVNNDLNEFGVSDNGNSGQTKDDKNHNDKYNSHDAINEHDSGLGLHNDPVAKVTRYKKNLREYENNMQGSSDLRKYEYEYKDSEIESEACKHGCKEYLKQERIASETDNDEEKARLDKTFGYTGPTAHDEPENIIRPCALNDWQCIRRYFAANGNCSVVYGPIPDPLTIDLNTVFFPVVNVTVTFPNFNLRGLSSAKVNEFYVNKKSGNLVFAIDIQNLSQTTPRAYLRYRRTAKESIILADYATFSFRAVTFTAVIPKATNLRLDLADVHVDAQDSIPAFFFGPGAYNSTDPDVVTAFSQFPILLPIAVREGFFFQSPLFTAIYIQNNICDFGLQLISV